MIEGDIRKSVIVDAPPETIFRALTDPRELIEWFPREAKIATHEEGEYEFKTGDPRSGVDVVIHGRILRLIPNKMLSMSWNSDSIPGSESVVTWILDPLPSGKTSVTLVHSGLPSRSKDKVGREWAVILGLLQTHYQVATAKAGSLGGAASQTVAPLRVAKSSWAWDRPKTSGVMALVIILIAASSFGYYQVGHAPGTSSSSTSSGVPSTAGEITSSTPSTGTSSTNVITSSPGTSTGTVSTGSTPTVIGTTQSTSTVTARFASCTTCLVTLGNNSITSTTTLGTTNSSNFSVHSNTIRILASASCSNPLKGCGFSYDWYLYRVGVQSPTCSTGAGPLCVNLTRGADYYVSVTNFGACGGLCRWTVTAMQPGQIIVVPESGRVGDNVNVSGVGFDSLSGILVQYFHQLTNYTTEWSLVTTTPASCTADSLGNFSCSFVVPNLTPASYTFEVDDTFGNVVTFGFTVN